MEASIVKNLAGILGRLSVGCRESAACAIHLATTVALVEGMIRDVSQGKDIQQKMDFLACDLADLSLI
jgi:hypothetical protein